MVSPDPQRSAESLFAAWLARSEAGEEAPFDGLLAAHPEHAGELAELFSQWQRLERIRREQGLAGSLSERLKIRFGSGVDPQVTLSVERGAASSDAGSGGSAAVISRLAGRGPASSRYRLEGEIGHGGMGAVLRVRDEDLRRHLAMKVMLGKGAAAASGNTPPSERVDPKLLSRFLEEAQVTGQLDHPGIVPVHELGLDVEGRVYFTMKLVKGQTLKEVFDELARGEGGWTQPKVLGLLLKVCEAVSYAHAKGVIHRDLKPANVMVGRYGEVYVMDWGLAKVLGRADDKDIRVRTEGLLTTSAVESDRAGHAGETPDSPLFTMDGDVVGTPAYMPPEQARGELEAMGAHSDVYALGAMLYHLIAGHMPYLPPGTKGTNYAVWRWVQDGPPKALHELAPETPAELVAICGKAMAREFTQRYRDTKALAEDLSAYVEGRVVQAYETGAWAEARKWVRRNKPLAASLLAAVVLLVAGLVTAVTLRQQAVDNLALAKRNEEAAKEQGRIAKEQELEATRRADDVLRLSALQDLEDLLGEADALWPAHPEHIAAFRAWIGRAEALVGALPQHRAKREQLRALALLRTEDQREAERASHPELGRIAALTGELEAKRRALVQRRDGVSAPLLEPDWSAYPADASALNGVAWPLIAPSRTSFGEEPLGLVLALRALELAGEDADLVATIGDTLAWAYASLGRDAEAAAASRAALEASAAERKQEFAGYLAKIEAQASAATTQEGLRAADAELERLQNELAALESRVDERRDWRFPEEHGEARWWDAQLTKLIVGLEALQSGLLAKDAVTSDRGWSMAKRLAFALDLESGFAPGGRYAQAWERDLASIRAAYPGLDLKPQMGLLPIGPDPVSGLWEFAHLMTGVPAERGADGKLVLREETGVVLVLIRSGRFWMGAQSSDPTGRNYDPQAQSEECPVHEVELSAYFLSKYELTQGQWERLTGRNPSGYGPRRYLTSWNSAGQGWSALHPVEQITWVDCMAWLPRAGLALPSEAQWENGCRGGTSSVYWSGDAKESLQGVANLSDEYGKNHGNQSWPVWEPWLDDGNTAHAVVGSYRANELGLHDVHGNLWEWCLDGYDGGFYGRSPPKDPVAPWEGATDRVNRGGGFGRAASDARSAYRGGDAPSGAVGDLGVRPARVITE